MSPTSLFSVELYSLLSAAYTMIDSDDCESKGMKMVATKKECEDAAEKLDLKGKRAYEMQLAERPMGCIYGIADNTAATDWLSWASPKNHPSFHNTWNASCGSIHKFHNNIPVTYNCICNSRYDKRLVL